MITSEDLARTYGMMIVEEVQVLKECVDMLPEKPIIVNIGAGVGTSAAAILETRPNAFIFSVDKDRAPEEQVNLVKCGLNPHRCVRLLGRSQAIGLHFPIAIDLLFVDGAHYDEAVKNDILMWLPKVADGGIAVFHDYKHPNVPGLTTIVDEAMSKYPVIGQHRFLIAYKIDAK